ncbi:amidase [Tsukamurella sp. 8F]|uniref:amidase n=1 Tax=unclassified Tsukamurella TaxID=2633480 RepID=UPI0023BA39F1|nr:MULTISPECIES: amidase [unclassified Tsukamurella]MDF0528960.1 amidase [Tsukamurella sp. 8J]MDF0587333.1 amidase [Tsukamurella sp. 8F]
MTTAGTRQVSTLTDAAAALHAGHLTSLELVQDCIDVADRHDETLGAFIIRFTDEALAAAAQADADRAAGREPGALAGIPIGIKDIITTSEAPSTAQSLVLDPAWSHGDAVVVQRLRDAGAIILGKLTTMEFASGLPDAARDFPLPRNPWNLSHWPGGSSSGTGSGVAAGMFLGGLGTDTGGSIRIPAAFCGITGLMPTFGRVPKSGCVPLGYSLDHIGPMARSARDCATMLTVLAGHHPSDHTAIDTPTSDYTTALTADLTGLRIGVDLTSGRDTADVDPALDPALDRAIEVLQNRGAETVPVTLPRYREVTEALFVINNGETLAYHRGDARRRLADYSPSLRLSLPSATADSAADYVQAQRVRRVAHQELANLYADRGLDLILTATAYTGALAYDELDIGLSWFDSINTAYWDPMGNPVVSVPIGFTADRLPLAMQLAGRPFDEATVLRAADAFQQSTDWHRAGPDLSREGAS